MPTSEFMRRNAEPRIAAIQKKYRKKFIHPVYDVVFWSSNYQKLPNGHYAIYDNPDNRGYTTGIAI